MGHFSQWLCFSSSISHTLRLKKMAMTWLWRTPAVTVAYVCVQHHLTSNHLSRLCALFSWIGLVNGPLWGGTGSWLTAWRSGFRKVCLQLRTWVRIKHNSLSYSVLTCGSLWCRVDGALSLFLAIAQIWDILLLFVSFSVQSQEFISPLCLFQEQIAK